MFQNLFTNLRNRYLRHDISERTRFFILCFIIIATGARIQIYGDPKLSVSGNDTISYVEASHVPLFSSEIMTGRRLLSTNLIYKVLEPKDGYQILANGSIETTHRIFQPGFDRIAILQLILSVAGWGLLAFFISDHIKTPYMKVISAVTVILFAFTPQMADWDSILMSESLTFSLFALQLAFLVKLAFTIYQDPHSNIFPYLAAWAITYFVWTFLRDTNLFASFVTGGMISILLFSIRYRRNKYLQGMLAFVIMILIIGLFTSGNSTRSLVQIVNIYNDDLLISPARVATLTELGMPDPNSAEYKTWFPEKSTSTLIKFMLIHPGYPTTKIINDFPMAFTEIKQTYFNIREHASTRKFLMAIGDTLHPENMAPFLLNIFLLFGLFQLAIKNVSEASRPWAWIGIWLFLTATTALIPTILGDTWALNRHALFSTMIYRLCMWLFTFIIMDIALDGATKPQII